MKYKEALKGYIDAKGKFSHFPGKRQKEKQEIMLQYLAEQLEAGREYSEVEVNDILNQHHSFGDPATLRRLMFGKKFIDRTIDGRRYWLVENSAVINNTI